MKKRILLTACLCTFLGLNPVVHEVANWSSAEFQKIDIVPVSNKLFGLFPLKASQSELEKPDIRLLPGGQSIGVSLQAKGVMVVGQAAILDAQGKLNYPAKEAGIQLGDVILKIDGQAVFSDQEVANAIHRSGEKSGYADLLLNHKNQQIEKRVKTILCSETNRFRVGLYIRNEAAGVGTLSFYDPNSGKYGALGHVINDVDTDQKIDVLNGKILGSTIQAIEKGRRGQPGEKIGSFVNQSKFTGNIEINSVAGIFGSLRGDLQNPFFPGPILVAGENEVKEGPAKIYTVLEREAIEEFDVMIERISINRSDCKNMIIKVTDPRLLERTGGIIQGMSGSPMIQNGKLVGVITHVFVNDATRGYAVFMTQMLKEAGLLVKKEAA